MPHLQRYAVGLHNVGSYQISGWPYITGSAMNSGQVHKIEFPMVAKSIMIVVSGTFDTTACLRVHFQPDGAAGGGVYKGHHYLTLGTDDSVSLDVKCKEIYISAHGAAPDAGGGYELMAELTNIPTASMYNLTGSGVTEETEAGSFTP